MADKRKSIKIIFKTKRQYDEVKLLEQSLKRAFPEMGILELRRLSLIKGIKLELEGQAPLTPVEELVKKMSREMTGMRIDMELFQEMFLTFFNMYANRFFDASDGAQEALKGFLNRNPVKEPFEVTGVEKLRRKKYGKS